MAQQELFLNVLDSTLTGYIQLEPQLREYLEELYPASSYGYIAFNICYENDRWFFYGPFELARSEIKYRASLSQKRRRGARLTFDRAITIEVVRRKKAANATSEARKAGGRS